MLEKIARISSDTLEDLRLHCRKLREIMTSDVSNYSKGRQQLWLFNRCDLRRSAQIFEAYYDERIYQLSQRIYPGCNIGMLTYNGLIKRHRDHNYAMPEACLLNLGEADFSYDDELYRLKDGEIFKFNCKRPHAVERISEERYSIVFWKLRSGYHDFLKERNKN